MKIFHNEDLSQMKLKLGTTKKFSEDYSFIPIHIVSQDKRIPLLIQTPQMFIPYGITQNDENNKTHCTISFHNKENDQITRDLLKDFINIQDKIIKNFDNYSVNPFLKDSLYSECMKLKIIESSKHYNNQKKQIDKIECFSYGSFIIQLSGLWIQKKQMWFQWLLLQSRIDEKLEIQDYAFIDKRIPPPPPLPKSFSSISKYHSMIKVGVPKNAVIQKMKQDNVDPSLLEKNEKILETPSRNLITSDMLQSVKLKKKNSFTKEVNKDLEKKPDKKKDNRVPSLEEIQSALKRLKKVKD